jgi:hypothetical protein
MRNTVLLLLRTGALSSVLVTALAGAEFLPLAPGNTWVYRSAQTQSEITIRVGSNVLYLGSTGKAYHPLVGYATKPLYVRADESGSLLALDLDTNTETLLTSFDESRRHWWPAPYRPCEQEGEVERVRIPYLGTAGRIEATLSILYRSYNCADAGARYELFAENVGMLRREETTIAGPVLYDLVYARVGSMIIAESPHTSFLLSVRAGCGEALAADIHLTSNADAPIKLTFPSSLEFDVALRNAAGRVVWRYSDYNYSIPIVKEKLVNELSYSVSIPLSPNGVSLPSGDYTVEAWLLTADEDRKFAATTSVRISGPAELRVPLRARMGR